METYSEILKYKLKIIVWQHSFANNIIHEIIFILFVLAKIDKLYAWMLVDGDMVVM
jgi:hypothetical protein